MPIRGAKPEDVTALMRLFHCLDKNYSDNPEAILASLNQPGTIVLVFEEDGQVQGTATLSVRGSPTQGLIGHVDNRIVEPALRRPEIWNELLDKCYEIAGEIGCLYIDFDESGLRVAPPKPGQKDGFFRRLSDVLAKTP